jgi:formylglycine-generating enzyme required for sulfatase activity/energy-coupling factor transporter ATP-binding protein EcfA2
MTDVGRLKQELEEIEQELLTAKEGSLARKLLLERRAELIGSGAIAQGENSKAVGEKGVMAEGSVGGNVVTGTVVIASNGAKVVIGEQPVEMKPELRNKVLGRYLEHVIAQNRYLQLQGIRSGGKLVNIELEQIYISLRTTQQRSVQAEDEWLRHEAGFAPGEMNKRMERLATEIVNVSIEQALAGHNHMVVLGDPGSGKTTLLKYLALIYGRELAEGSTLVKSELNLNESGHLPILLQLRQIGAYLKAHRPQDDGTEGHGLLLDFLIQSLKNHKLDLPLDFFDPYLENGRAIVLLDGMDEVADPDLRTRVARLVESFTLAYPHCRFVVTSRVVGYSGSARLQADYTTTTVNDFSLDDIRQFLTHWHSLVAIGQMGAGEDAENYAASQTQQLMNAIQGNERVRDLAINPLMLTVIALVHRDRVKLPDRRAELYAEAVDVLLGKWDEARGVDEIRILDDRAFDAGDRRLVLQNIALHMHEQEKKEIETAELRTLLQSAFKGMTTDNAAVRRATDRFLTVIEERTGLLSARGEGVYAFSHLTFQEYLAALEIAARDDYVEYILARSASPWWRETILLTAGYLSTQSKERTTKLIKAIAENKKEPAPYYNLVLASECIRDAGNNRVDPQVEEYTKKQLRKALNVPQRSLNFIEKRIFGKSKPDWIERRGQAIETLVKAGAGYWYPPHGEPEWVTIPAGEFWMGESATAHKVYLPEYQIARVPVTNAQYALFVKATDHKVPDHWQDGRIPKGQESHPVTYVTLDNAIEYCEWLSRMTGKQITLPSEAEWEKAVRGEKDKREYPWGDEFDPAKCNSSELKLGDTTPVGIFVEGASPYGVLDMSGNVWEWTRTNYETGIDDFHSRDSRVLRGGSYYVGAWYVRCALRGRLDPYGWNLNVGFRVVVSHAS